MMTIRQKLLKAFYPVVMWVSGKTGTNAEKLFHTPVIPPESIYGLSATLNSGDLLDFSSLKGKKILVVNTASDCGYTGQYAGLQQLFEQKKDKLVIIGFPANDFKQQEKGSDESIARFCKVNFGVNFPLTKKARVVKGAGQHDVYKWLTDPKRNGWNSKAPSWNFSKYLISETGSLLNYFGPGVEPLSDEVTNAI